MHVVSDYTFPPPLRLHVAGEKVQLLILRGVQLHFSLRNQLRYLGGLRQWCTTTTNYEILKVQSKHNLLRYNFQYEEETKE
ncbi:hypothetical protein K7X08_009651 [Anisodus acutangulus]|uniref:Uncharacterized protein n=1 Tax=Anisodus acutangulus TaxID=402998 RepID=A0A9Q1RR07_9SOLA|nr:hypothetical protein K7X08_009651 [Anisodus acutangulus]